MNVFVFRFVLLFNLRVRFHVPLNLTEFLPAIFPVGESITLNHSLLSFLMCRLPINPSQPRYYIGRFPVAAVIHHTAVPNIHRIVFATNSENTMFDTSDGPHNICLIALIPPIWTERVKHLGTILSATFQQIRSTVIQILVCHDWNFNWNYFFVSFIYSIYPRNVVYWKNTMKIREVYLSKNIEIMLKSFTEMTRK